MDEPASSPRTPNLTPPRVGFNQSPDVLTSPSNTLGMAALVSSLLGLTVVPVLGSIAGLVLGVMGLRRQPRGLAISAVVLSLLGLLAGAFVAFLFLSVASLRPMPLPTPPPGSAANRVLIEQKAANFLRQHPQPPADIAALFPNEAVPVDMWGVPFRIRVEGEVVVVESAGLDEVFDTEDDEASRVDRSTFDFNDPKSDF